MLRTVIPHHGVLKRSHAASFDTCTSEAYVCTTAADYTLQPHAYHKTSRSKRMRSSMPLHPLSQNKVNTCVSYPSQADDSKHTERLLRSDNDVSDSNDDHLLQNGMDVDEPTQLPTDLRVHTATMDLCTRDNISSDWIKEATTCSTCHLTCSDAAQRRECNSCGKVYCGACIAKLSVCAACADRNELICCQLVDISASYKLCYDCHENHFKLGAF